MQRLKHILHRYFIQLIPLSLCVEIKNLPKVIDLTCGYFQNLRLNLDTTGEKNACAQCAIDDTRVGQNGTRKRCHMGLVRFGTALAFA